MPNSGCRINRRSFHWSALVLTLFAILLCCSFSEQSQLQKSKMRRKLVVNPKSTLECHRREYTFKAINRDEASGKKCSGYITVESCWGRCNSGEISDYNFPFKKSFHFVCMHGETKKTIYELSDCDTGASEYLRYYEAVVAKTCVCRQCDTSQVNCESVSHAYN